jgi:predicted nucleotidyltransferase
MKSLLDALSKKTSELPFCPIGDLYLFGSALRTTSFRDLDLLLVVDPIVVPLCRAHTLASPMLKVIEHTVGVRVDLTLLSSSEEARDGFANLVGANLVSIAWHNKAINSDASLSRRTGYGCR